MVFFFVLIVVFPSPRVDVRISWVYTRGRQALKIVVVCVFVWDCEVQVCVNWGAVPFHLWPTCGILMKWDLTPPVPLVCI